MRIKERMKKGFSVLLALNMVLSSVPLPVFAAEGCTHVHSEACYALVSCLHTCGEECAAGCTHDGCTVDSGCVTRSLDCHHTHGDCGYSEGTPEVPCGHTHVSCGYVEAVAGTPCANAETDPACDHSGDCGFVAAVEGVPCGHKEHTDCGYAAATQGTPCTHVCEVKVDSADSCYQLLCSHRDGGHDDACGYVAAVVGHECHFECPDCAAVLVSGHQPEQGVEMDEAIKSLQELIDALPDADEITQENRENVISLMEAIDAEKAELTDAQREMVDFSKFAAVAAVLSGGVSDAVMPISLHWVYLDSATGDDRNSGAASNSPVKTFSKALELVADGGTIVLGEYGGSIEDPQFIIEKNITISSDEGSTLQAVDLILAANVTFYNSKLFCTDLTIQSGVTLDLSKLTVGDIIFTIGDDQTTSLAMAVNNGAIKFPADFSLNDAPKSGTVYIGEKNYVWNNDRWNCGSDSAHTTQKPENKGTCKKKAVCDLCGTEYGDPDPDAHTLTHVEAVVPANCQKTGHDEYWYCDGCETCFGDAEASYWVEISWISYTGNHVRPVGAAPCAVVPCALCGEDTYGDDECDRGDTPKCQDAVCINCGETVPGWGCNYNSGDEEEFLPLCLPGDCVYCGKHYEYLYEHENNSWKPCIEPGECVYECGMQFPATGEHNLAEPCAGGVCTYCWNEVGPQHSYDNIPNDDGLTHSVVCSGCGTEVTENHSTEKEENKANCQQGDICDLCGTEYGEKSQTNHDESVMYTETDNGFCPHCGAYQSAVLNGDVYEISNAGQLYWFAAQVNSGKVNIHGKLMNNIVVNENVLNADGSLNGDGSGFRQWTPIGQYISETDNPGFAGTFNGNGKTIRGLYHYGDSAKYAGLFGYSAGTIRDLAIADAYIHTTHSDGRAGSVTGLNEGTVSNCHNSGFVGGNGQIGGIVGRMNAGTIENCSNSGTITGNSYVGGICGYEGGKIQNCSNSGTVNGNLDVGGIAGWNRGAIEKCSNSGTITGNSHVGGVAGLVSGGTINNCYNVGSVEATNECAGGIAGGVQNTSNISNCFSGGPVKVPSSVGGIVGNVLNNSATNVTITNGYYDNHVYSGNDIDTIGPQAKVTRTKVEGKTTEAFSSGEVTWLLNGESAEGVWKQTLNTDAVPGFTGGTVYYGYVDCGSTEAVYTNTIVSTEPVEHDYDNGFCEQVSGQTHYEPATLVTAENCTELGLADSYIGYYAITNAGQLYWIADKVDNDNANFGAANVVLTDNITVNSGTLTANSAGARVWNPIGWYTYRNSDTAVFSGTFDGNGKTVSGLYYNDSTKTSRYIGLVACVAEGGTVKHVTLSNSYISGYRHTGGIAGENYGTITGCVNNAAIGGEGEQGGIVGENYGTVELCGNTGTITNTWCYSGGIVGYSYGIIRNCWNTGSFSGGTSCAGGIVGTQEGRDSLTENCWSKGQVTGMSCGSISGWLNGAATVQNCYSDKDPLVGNRSSNNGTPITTNVQYKSTAAFASGEVAYLLRTLAAAGTNVWGQNLDNGQTVQTVPTFDGADVYCGYASCADTKVKYTNNASVSTTPIAHDWGCTATGAQIVGTCVNGCGTDGGKVTLTLDGTAVYDGTKKTVKAVGSLEGIDTLPGVTYAGDRINVGTFTADLTLEDGTKAQLEVTITAKEITPTVEGVQSTYSYNGEAIKPAVTVKDGETVLREGTNYDVTYGENTNCATGGSVKVTLKGNYEGSAEETFTITAKEITPTVEGVQSTYSYNGEVIKPTVTVKDGEIVLVEGVDYHITYGSNTNVADRGSVKVTLKGNYEGSAEETFAIAPKEVTELTFVGLNEVYAHTGEAIVPTFNVKDGETTLSEGMDYTAAITNNTDVGTATITITLKENYTGTVTKTFEIKPHVHEWNYELSGANTIVAKCSGTIGTCPVKTATIKIAAEDKTYDGNPVTATLTGKIDGVDTPAIRYFKNGAELNESVINAGTYTASIKLGEAEAKVNFTIAKAEIDGSTLINPEFAEGLIYNGTAQALVTKTGSVDGGYIVFSLNPDGEYTAEIPVATEAGKYVVFYRIEGDENHYWEGTSAYNTVTIAKANPEYTIPTGLTATYGDTLAKVELPTGWTWKDAETTSVGNAGTRTFKAIFTPADTGNYNTVETDVTVEVAKADPEYTVPTGLTATYGNTLADVELPAGWTWKDAETTSVGNAGTNTFQAIFTPADTTNYTVVESGVTITVAKATASVETAPAANTLIYTGEAQALVTAGAANNGEMQYSTDNRTWSTTIPTGTNAGDYTVYYKVVGDANHIDTGVQSVVVKIGQLAVAEPTVSGTYTYTGKEQMVTLTGVESYMTVVSGNKAVGAGSYEAVITLDGNHKWADGSDGKVQWSIGKAEFGDVYVSQSGMLTYNGTAQTPNVNTDADSVGDQTATFAYRLTENESYGEMPAFTDAGTYTVYYKASAPNHKDATGSFTVMVDKAKAEITVDTDPITVTYGDTVELPDATANFGTVSCDKTAAELVNVGTYTVTYTVAGTDNYDGDTKTVTVKINPKAITEDDVQLNGSLVYTGSEQTQQITVTAGIDFEVTGNKATNVGSYTLTVTASGNYTGSVTKDWSIKSAAAIVETAPKANNLTYTGEAQELVTAGTAKGGKLVYSLTEDGEYTETIPAGTNVGEYTVWYYVDGDYNHSDSAKASVKVTIAKAKAEISVDTTPITVTYGETVELPNATSSFGTVSCDKTADELVNAGTYTVTYTVEGTDNYEGDTKTVTVTIEKLAVAEPTVTGTYTYTGEEQTAQLTGVESCMTVASGDKATNAGSYEVEITLDGNHQWAEGSDGKVQWSIGKAQAEIAVNTDPITAVYGGTVKLPEATANFGTVTCDTTADKLVNAGTYTVTYTVASTANFDGDSKTVTVTVNPKAITEADVSLNGSLVYTGSELTQAVTVTAGVTYEVTDNKATNVGSYTLTVTASGNYTGSVTKDWSIGKAVATVETAPTAKELTYTGAAQALVTAGTANGGKLVYSLSENGIYAETIPTGTNAGDYMVWYYVQGDDNHADSAKASVKVTIAKAKAEISVNTTPITVTYGEAVMLPTATSSFGTVSRDKTAAELVNAGTYTVTYTVEGTANYEGDTKTLTVIVEKKAVAEPAVTGTYTYTGEEQTAQLTGVESCMTIASGDKATNAGSYEVVITLDGNHKWADGSDGKVQWSIGKAEFGDVYVSQSGMLTYNGTAQTPNVNTDADSVGDQTATFAYRLTENESYGEMPAFTDAGTYTVYYKASAPNHKDATGSFTVTVDKAKAEIAVNTDPITVVYGEAVVLPTATTNFGTVACDKTASDLVNAGTYTVTYSVAGSDNYNGDTKTITVTVNAKVVNQPVIEGIEAVYILSENAITPVPTAVKDGATVIDPSEYTLAYENNTAAGTATVKIVDKDGGNYTVNGSMTFQIVEHEHTWTYTTDSNASKIIATCSNADGHCPNTNGGSVSIQDPDELTYDGSTKDAELVYESWQPEEVTITYNNVDRVNVTGKEIVASIGVVGAGIQSVYTIVAAALPNATLSADSGTYTGQAHTVTVVLDTLVKDTDYTVSIPEDMTNVGTKTITVNGKGNYEGTQTLTYTISKADPSVTTAPAAVVELVYNGRNQNLITTGTATGGTMHYSLDGETWTAAIPAGKNAGEYTVHYKVVGDSNHNDADAETVTVTIAKAAATVETIPTQKHFHYAAATKSLDLSSYLPADRGETTFTLDTKTGTVFENSTAITANTLSYTTKVTEAPANGEIKVKVVMENYEDVTLTVKVELVAVTAQTEERIVKNDLAEVPVGLANDPELDTVAEIKDAQKRVLDLLLGHDPQNNIAHYDVKLQFSPDGGKTWVDATEENFPEAGLTVTLPYPSGTGKDSHRFVVSHMFTTGSKAGTTETPAVTKTATGIRFKVTGLSPVSVAWEAIPFDVKIATVTNGTVYVSPAHTEAGTQVTITATPKSGYKLSTLTVKDAAGNSYTVSTDNNDKYYFTMPAADVTVTATFTAKSNSVADTTNPKTGDSFQLVLWSSMTTTSLLALAVLLKNKKKYYQK